MKILAIETSSAACSIALMVDDDILAMHEMMPMQHAKNILPMIKKLLHTKDIDLKQLDAVAFGCGPGSFTGIRLAASVAQGLGYACQLPLIPVSSLAAIAQATYQDLQWDSLIVAIDARIQEIYYAQYHLNNGLMALLGDEVVGKPEKMIINQGDKNWCGVGNAWEVYASAISYKPRKLDITRLPNATAIALIAKEKLQKGEIIHDPALALPIYLRENIAKKQEKNSFNQ